MDKRRIEWILVATDGSERSLEAARYAAELAQRLKVRATLVHVVPIPGPQTERSRINPEDETDVEKALFEGAQVILDRTREPFDQVAISVEGLIRRGEPDEAIAKLAREEGYDLIVVAGHEADGADTSEAIVRASPCPVLVVK